MPDDHGTTGQPKVFCIGFHKTGTTSLGDALTTLGYRVTGLAGKNDPEIGNHVLDMARRLVGEFDAFQDNPWPILYRELDAMCPGSKFILTLRDPEPWIRSQVRHFGRSETPMRRWIYGVGHNHAGQPARNQSIGVWNVSAVDQFRGHGQTSDFHRGRCGVHYLNVSGIGHGKTRTGRAEFHRNRLTQWQYRWQFTDTYSYWVASFVFGERVSRLDLGFELPQDQSSAPTEQRL